MAEYSFGKGLTLDPGAEMQAGYEKGRQMALQRLIGQAYSATGDARDSLLKQAAMIDPGTTIKAQQSLSALDDAGVKDAVQSMGMAAAAWKAGAKDVAQGFYAKAKPALAQMTGGAPLPDQLDDQGAAAMEHIAAQATGRQPLAPRVIGSDLVDSTGRVLYHGQAAESKPVFRTDAQGNGYWLQPGKAPVPVGQAAPSGNVTDASGAQVSIDPSLPPEVRADIAANPQKWANAGAVQAATPATASPRINFGKPAAADALQQKIAVARQLGASDADIKAMVLGTKPAQDGGGAVNAPGDASKTGAAYMATLPKDVAAQVKALAEGRMAFPTGTALKSPYWQGMLSAVSQYDPSFDAINYNSRSKTRADFTSGKAATNIQALNTLAGHIRDLNEAADGLHNTGLPLWNSVANKALDMAGDPRVRDFNQTKIAVANELTRVFRGNGGAEADVQGWLKQLDDSQSPQQFKAVISRMSDQIESRIKALQESYTQGMGIAAQGRNFVTPANQQFFDSLRGATPQKAKPQPATGGWSIQKVTP